MAKRPLPTRDPACEERKHADHAKQQAQHAKDLHIANQINAITQIRDLTKQIVIGFVLIAVMQIADDGRQCQEPIGVRQHQERNGGE